MSRCIILSYGPVPTPEHDKVEGGGLRCWGLAKGLYANNIKNVTVAYNSQYTKENYTKEYEGIHIATWDFENLEELIQQYDTVVVSYCMGELSTQVAALIRPDQQLVLDCYVPIYVEISARQSDNLLEEYASFNAEVKNWADVLKRGDVFLCANDNQKRYYQGVLSALGRINPATYGEKLILVVPYGVYRDIPKTKQKPITTLLSSKDKTTKKLLWFGAVYPWFDPRILIDAVNKANEHIPIKLVIVGAKNPFNNHPDFVKQYDNLIEYIASNKEAQKHVVMQDWIDFSARADWYLDSDLVILINKLGDENELAWRTRLVDYVWADLPIITNGGDPLSELLISKKAAVRLNALDANGISEELVNTFKDNKKLTQLKDNISQVRQKLYWDVVTHELSGFIQKHVRPRDVREFGLIESLNAATRPLSLMARVRAKSQRLPEYYKKHGARSTFYVIRTMALNQKKRAGLSSRSPRVLFVSHQLNATGGPIVFMDMVKEFRRRYSRTQLEFHTFNPVESDSIAALNKVGIKPRVHLIKDIVLDYKIGDVVVLNTVAFSPIFMNGLYSAIRQGIVKKVIWYVHEDEPEYIFKQHEKLQVKQLMSEGKLSIYTPAIKSTKNYQRFFDDEKHILKQYYKLNLTKNLQIERQKSDFNKINFVLPGMAGDGRKGQLPVFYAFSIFKKYHYDTAKQKYRDFSLTFVGLGEDFYSRQILNHTQSMLGKHFKYHQGVAHDKALQLIKEANFSVCYSMRECLPRVVFEGMYAGHPILRNDCSGIDEQFNDNGYYLDSKNLNQVVEVIEEILNKEKTDNSKLLNMSKQSQKLVNKFESQPSFQNIIEDIHASFNN